MTNIGWSLTTLVILRSGASRVSKDARWFS